MRRKQLAKVLSLRYGQDKDYYRDILTDMGMDAAARPEDLGAAEWLDLYGRAGAR